jgi:hypothetical protein
VAWRHGQARILTPEHFPFCGSAAEVLDRVRIKLALKPELRKKLDGCWISAMLVDGSIRVAERTEDMRGHL